MKRSLAFALVFAVACQQQQGVPPPQPAELVLTNGKIVTVDKDFSIKQAIAIRAGKIVAVGAANAGIIPALIGPSTTVVDLKGRTVLPGLIDSHAHAIRAGLTWDFELHWERLASLKDGLEQIAAKAKAQPVGSWIRVIGGWHEIQLAKRLPTQAELDQAAPNHPVWVQRLSSRVVLNSAAVKALNITETTADPPGGQIVKEGGKPTGLANLPAINAYYPNIPRPSLDQQIEGTKHAFADLNRSGLTGVIDAGGGGQRWPDDYQALTTIHERGQQTLRVRWFMMPQRAGRELEDVRTFISIVKPRGGTDMLQPLGVGEAIVAATNDGTQWGADSPTFPPQAIDAFSQVLRTVVDGGWSFHLHVARNKSLEQLLPKIEEINRATPLKDRRVTFAHVEDASPQSIERIKALGAGVALQDRLIYSGEDILKNWTPEMVRRAPPVGSILKAGINVGGGTDGTQVAPYPPFLSLWWFITGKTADGRATRAGDELVTREQALRIYTTGSAWLAGDEAKLGSLEEGKLADLIVLSADYLTVPEEQIKTIESVLTIVGGKPVYASGEFKPLAP